MPATTFYFDMSGNQRLRVHRGGNVDSILSRDQTRAEFDNQGIRLNASLSPATFQMDNIRVKYRPLGFACHIPFVTPIIDLFSRYCTPIRTAPIR